MNVDYKELQASLILGQRWKPIEQFMFTVVVDWASSVLYEANMKLWNCSTSMAFLGAYETYILKPILL